MSDFIDQYSILFEGLETGSHHFTFKMDDKFFDHYQNPESLKGDMVVNVEMDKKSDLLSLVFEFEGNIRVVCDRCLDYLDMPMSFSSSLFIKFSGKKEVSEDAEVMILEPGEKGVNLAGCFIENVLLQLPIKRVHKKGSDGVSLCNKEMLEILDNYQKESFKGKTDPRWDKLKKLMHN